MDAKRREKTATRGYAFAEVEQALAVTFGMVTPAQRGSLRGRLTHFRRLGFAPKGRPGPGLPITYYQDDTDRWLVALELEHFGPDPAKVVELLNLTWNPSARERRRIGIAEQETIRHHVAEARAAGEPAAHVIMLVRPWAMSELPGIGYTTPALSIGQLLATPAGRRIAAFDLTARLQTFDAALGGALTPTALAPYPKQPGVSGEEEAAAEDFVAKTLAATRKAGEPEPE